MSQVWQVPGVVRLTRLTQIFSSTLKKMKQQACGGFTQPAEMGICDGYGDILCGTG